MTAATPPECITVRTEGRVGIVTLNRPKQLNALNNQLMDELGAALKAFDLDDGIGCMIITGSEKAFAAGADIGAMATYTFADVYKGDYITRNWETIRSVRKPVIAAVSGFALGGGCELAMMCDFIIAADNAKFGQPEINLGVIPGAVTAFGVFNDKGNNVTIVLDADLMENEIINCHPLSNDATTSIGRDDLVRFMEATGHTPLVLKVTA